MERTRNILPFGLRMQPELKNWVKEQAERNKRSVNSEIILRLEKSKVEQEGKRNVAKG